jgi:hypothetical protein
MASVPSPPNILTGRSLAQLVWQPSAGATGYNIYRDAALAGSVSGPLYYIDEGLILGTSYAYTLSAVNASGESGQSLPVTATTAIWTKIICSSATDYASGVALDGSGNFYVTGYTTGNLDGQTNAGLKDIFTMKFDAAGTKQWTKLLGTAANEEATAVAVDASGNVYITGYTDGNLDGQTNAGGDDIFIAKYDTSGNLQWVTLLGTPADEWGNGIALDASGNVYITGYTDGNLDGQTNAGGDDIFIAKYDASGNLQWVTLLGTPADDAGNAIASDASGNLYITGYTAGNLSGLTNAGGKDVFLAAYNAAGTKQWVALLGTPADDVGNAIALGPSAALCATGYTGGNLDGQTNAGGIDAFITAYNTSGTKQWTSLIGTSASDAGNGVAFDASGNSYITGYTYGNLSSLYGSMGGGSGGGSQTNAGSNDILAAKYDASGMNLWAGLMGTPANDSGAAITLDQYGNSYIVGSTAGNLDGLTNTDSSGGFIAKLASDGTIW